jgi:hypothetical protein
MVSLGYRLKDEPVHARITHYVKQVQYMEPQEDLHFSRAITFVIIQFRMQERLVLSM